MAKLAGIWENKAKTGVFGFEGKEAENWRFGGVVLSQSYNNIK